MLDAFSDVMEGICAISEIILPEAEICITLYPCSSSPGDT
jgi:hypothetical protein